MQNPDSTSPCLSVPKVFKLIIILLSAALLLAGLMGLPREPFSLIASTKKSVSKQQLLILPSIKLSESLAVNPCSKEQINTLYENLTNFQSANAGLKVFKARLNKEYKQGSKSLSSLARKLLTEPQPSVKQTNTCLLPLKINADKNLAVEIKSSKLLEVSVGSESIICSEAKAYLIPDSRSSKLYPLSLSLVSYAGRIKDRQIVPELKRKLVKLQASKAKNKTEGLKKETLLREISLALTYAQYFSKDGLILASFYDSVCAQAAAIATPVAKNTAAALPTAVPTTIVTATRIPTVVATPTPETADPTEILSSPSWVNRAFSNQTASFRITFKAVPLSNNIDALTGLSNGPAISYNSLGPILRFNSSGSIDARNGAAYAAVSTVNYSANKEYFISLDVHLASRTYSLSVRDQAGLTSQIASNYAFRTSQAQVSQLNNFAVYGEVGSHRIMNISAPSAINPPSPTPTSIPGACGNIPNGGTETQNGFQTSSVPAGQSCVSKVQSRTCNNGNFTPWSGPLTCFVEQAPESNVCEPTGSAISIPRFGITWEFDRAYPCGKFANGDYWVVPIAGVNDGKVKIVNITPASVNVGGWIKNGTVVNPKPNPDNGWHVENGFYPQGFDSSSNQPLYVNQINVAPSNTGSPLLVAVNSSIVSSQSTNTQNDRPQVLEAEILTVLGSRPAPGSFRPAPGDPDKTVRWNKASLNYKILKTLRPVASTPSLSSVEAKFARPWLALNEGNAVQAMSPKLNMPNYGRDQAHELSEALLSLHLNYTDSQKEKLYVALVQYGIDIYGSLKAVESTNAKLSAIWKDTMFRGSGGLNNGRKVAVVLAGLALNDQNIKDWADARKHFVFAEDKQTFYVSQDEVNTIRYCEGERLTSPTQRCITKDEDPSKHVDNRPRDPYTTSMKDTPEWGEEHASFPGLDGSNWNTVYRWVGGSQLGNALGILLTEGGQAAWNHQVFFDYEDRYFNRETSNGFCRQTHINRDCVTSVNSIQRFVYDMWLEYR